MIFELAETKGGVLVSNVNQIGSDRWAFGGRRRKGKANQCFHYQINEKLTCEL